MNTSSIPCGNRKHVSILSCLRLNAKSFSGRYGTLFFQRPLKVQKYLIGKCELEPGERRAGRYLLLSQRFRLLQRVNDLRVLLAEGGERRLTAEERNKLIEALEFDGDQTFPAIKKLLGFGRTTHFNLEGSGETRLPGNRTASQMYSVFGGRWRAMAPAEKDYIVEYLHGFQRTDKLQAAGMRKFGIDVATAEKFASVKLEADYFGFSRRAMDKLLPSLEERVLCARTHSSMRMERK